MRSLALFLLLGGVAGAAEPRTITLKEAVDLALRQNPDLVLARLDVQKAELQIQATREPLLPRFVAGSGMAYTYGMPMSVEGSAPTVVQARAIRSIYNGTQRFMTGMAREDAAASSASAELVREDIALRTALLYLDLEQAHRAARLAQGQLESLQRIEAVVRLRVAEGRELEIEGKRAAVNAARARQRAAALQSARRAFAQSLALVLGLEPSQDLIPAAEPRPEPRLPESEEDAVRSALAQHPEIARLEASIRARGQEARAHRAARQPKIDLLAQYGLLAKFNNYDEFFNRFQRHNFQIGAAFTIPLFASPADEARAAQADIEGRRLRIELDRTRDHIEGGARGAWRQVEDAGLALEVARADLDLARDQVSLLLAQSGEGRATLAQLEQARVTENERWIALHDAQSALERARLELLRRANRLTASLH
jgi:outer membrane protein